jgi:hypothetical protein
LSWAFGSLGLLWRRHGLDPLTLKVSHSKRDRPFAILIGISTLLASYNDLLSNHRLTVLQPELAGTPLSHQLRAAKQVSACPWCQRCWVWAFKNASKERDAAKQRLFEHWWSSSICKEAVRVTETRSGKDPKL